MHLKFYGKHCKNYLSVYNMLGAHLIFLEKNLARNPVVSWAIKQLIPRSCTQLHLGMNASIAIISVSPTGEYATPITSC